MLTDISRLVEACAGMRVLVVGDAILDSYLEGTALRFCREAPVPNVTVHDRVDLAGGAANTARNVAALGAQVDFLTVLGDDEEARRLRDALQRHQVSCEGMVVEPGRRTRAKQRVLAESRLLLSFDGGDSCNVGAETARRLRERLAAAYPLADAVIVADYGYGALDDAFIQALAALQARHPRTLVIDSRHRLGAFRDARPTAVKPNYEEFQALLGVNFADPVADRAQLVLGYAPSVLARTGAELAAITLDSDGAVLIRRGEGAQRFFARPALVRCSAGAGDTYVATMAVALAQRLPLEVIGELAAGAASVVVSQERTASCSASELHEMFSPTHKVTELARLVERVECYKRQGRRVVFTNGCFDILHRGHVTLLQQAKSLGDVLIVGVNGDASIRRLKGANRPINTLDDRLQVLAALGCVDHVVGFEEDTSCELVRALRPHVFVKGGDYTRETLPEAQLVEALGGRVQVLPYLAERSTTGLIDRIRTRPAARRTYPAVAQRVES